MWIISIVTIKLLSAENSLGNDAIFKHVSEDRSCGIWCPGVLVGQGLVKVGLP